MRRARSLGLVGPSGCGKSTLLELVGGLREPRPARSRSAGELGRRAPRPLRVHAAARPAAALAGGDRQRRAGAAKPRRLARRGAPARRHPLFERFGLAGFERARPAELSGGMRQRVAFLRTLLAGKPVLLLDEPFASLDAITRAEMQEWLAEALAAEPDRDPGHPRRRGGALPVRPGGGALGPRPRSAVAELPRPVARDARAAPRGASPRRDGFTLAARGERAADGAARSERAMRRWLAPLAIVAGPARRLGAGGAAGRDRQRALPRALPRPRAERHRAVAVAATAALLADNAWVTLQEVLGGLRALGRRRGRLRGRPPPLADPAPRLLPAARRLPDGADRRRRADPGGLVRLRDRPQAGDHRPDLLLPDHRQHARRAAARSTPSW